jgi:tRNA pseudouridine13 synthase
MPKIKQVPEDFIVREIFEKQVTKEGWKSENEAYVWFDLTKRNYDLFRCLKLLSRRLGVSIKRFGYAGTKDKLGVTKQKISVWNVPVERLKDIRFKDIELSNFEINNERINLGDLKGNEFEIAIRDIEKSDLKRIEKKLDNIRKNGFINFYGEQRFGIRGDTHLVGKEILKNNLKEAVWLYLAHRGEENNEVAEFRKKLAESQDVKEGLKNCPKFLRNEIILMNHLIQKSNDYAGALRRLPKKFRTMLVHAYQSYLWNEVAKVSKEEVIPLIGFNTDLTKYKTGEQIEKILERENVKITDFKIRSMPELSCEGSERERMAKARGMKWRFAGDELNEGKLKCVLEFEIPKGSYATVLLDEILKAVE